MRLHEAIETVLGKSGKTVLVRSGNFAITNPHLLHERSGAFLTFALGEKNKADSVLFLNFPEYFNLIGAGVKGQDFIAYSAHRTTTFCPTLNDFVRDDWEVYYLEVR